MNNHASTHANNNYTWLLHGTPAPKKRSTSVYADADADTCLCVCITDKKV